MISLYTGGLFTLVQRIESRVFLDSKIWRARQFRQLSSGRDLKFCQYCQDKIRISTIEYKNALLGTDPYRDIPILAKDCRALKQDSFSSIKECLVYQEIDQIARRALEDFPENLELYDSESAETFLSAFLKRPDLEKNESDLTGDGGKLALKMLTSNNLISKFDCVLDIVVKRMKKRDILIITNLDREQFIKREKYFEDKNNVRNGVFPFNKMSNGSHYKSTIDLHFKNIMSKKYPNLNCIDEKSSVMKCSYLGNKNITLTADISFITVMFELE